MEVWVEKFKRLVRAVAIMGLTVFILTPALLVVSLVLSLINLENPIQSFKEVDDSLGLVDVYKTFIPHIREIIKGE